MAVISVFCTKAAIGTRAELSTTVIVNSKIMKVEPTLYRLPHSEVHNANASSCATQSYCSRVQDSIFLELYIQISITHIMLLLRVRRVAV